MDKMQLPHKYKLGITPIEFSGISVNLLHIWDREQNSSVLMQTSCTVFASVKNGQSFAHICEKDLSSQHRPNRCCSRLPFSFHTCSKITFAFLMGSPHGTMTTRAPTDITNLSAMEGNPFTITWGLKHTLTGLRSLEVNVLRHCTNACKILDTDQGKNKMLKIEENCLY